MPYDFHNPLGLFRFLRESLHIEGIMRGPKDAEVAATVAFLAAPVSVDALIALQAVYAPGKPLRDQFGMDVIVGLHTPPAGSPTMHARVNDALGVTDPFRAYCRFETLHPFMDGNGRTGRALWLHRMLAAGRTDPFGLTFLERFHYQALGHMDGAA